MVERAHAPGESKGRLVGDRERGREAKPFGHGRHSRDHQERVVVRDLDGLAQRRFGASPEAVVGADHVGQEDGIECPVLEQLGELGPELDLVEAVPVVVRVGPETVRDVPDTVHLEEVDVQLLWLSHRRSCSRGGEGSPRAGRGCNPAPGP